MWQWCHLHNAGRQSFTTQYELLSSKRFRKGNRYSFFSLLSANEQKARVLTVLDMWSTMYFLCFLPSLEVSKEVSLLAKLLAYFRLGAGMLDCLDYKPHNFPILRVLSGSQTPKHGFSGRQPTAAQNSYSCPNATYEWLLWGFWACWLCSGGFPSSTTIGSRLRKPSRVHCYLRAFFLNRKLGS